MTTTSGPTIHGLIANKLPNLSKIPGISTLVIAGLVRPPQTIVSTKADREPAALALAGCVLQ